MDLRTAYPEAAHLKSWRRTVRLRRAADQVEIEDIYQLTQAQPVTLNLITTCTIGQPTPGVLELTHPIWGKTLEPPSTATTSPIRIAYDSTLLTYSVDGMALENAELVRNWGTKAYRIRLTAKPATGGSLRLQIGRRV